MESHVQLLKTERGHVKLVYQNFDYVKKRENKDGKIVWHCAVSGCHGKLRTDCPPNYRHPEVTSNHNHSYDPARVPLLECRQAMKEMVKNDPEKVTTQIFREATLSTSEETVANLPSKDYVGRALRYERAKKRPPLPNTAQDLTLAPYQKVTVRGERFLLTDTVFNDERLLIFVSDTFLQHLCAANIVFADGTFRTVPRIFMQFYSINFMYQDKLLPAVYVLTRRKNEVTYREIIRRLKDAATERGSSFRPNAILTDFENGIMAAVQQELPSTRHRGCYFHFSQSCYRKLQFLGMQQLYSQSQEVRLMVRSVMSLAFLPTQQVFATFQAFFGLISIHRPILLPFMNYFRNQWITRIPPNVWNVHGEDIRTNNDLEGWHFSMKRALCRDHTDIHSFLK